MSSALIKYISQAENLGKAGPGMAEKIKALLAAHPGKAGLLAGAAGGAAAHEMMDEDEDEDSFVPPALKKYLR